MTNSLQDFVSLAHSNNMTVGAYVEVKNSHDIFGLITIILLVVVVGLFAWRTKWIEE